MQGTSVEPSWLEPTATYARFCRSAGGTGWKLGWTQAPWRAKSGFLESRGRIRYWGGAISSGRSFMRGIDSWSFKSLFVAAS